MALETPVVLHLRARNAINIELQSDGTARLSFAIPEMTNLVGGHEAKLLCVYGNPQPILVTCNFVRCQALDSSPVSVLGSSLSHANTYVPLRSEHMPSHCDFIFHNISGDPINSLADVYLAIRIVPVGYR